jgi:hypothetical protein
MEPSHRVWSWAVLVIAYAILAQADGTGFIGYGKTLYSPPCSFACRNVLRKQKLSCTPEAGGHNHGTAHNPVATPPECFVKDEPFLKTMALCIDTYCPLAGDPSRELILDYWASHLGTVTIGDYSWIPTMSYDDALAAARHDESNAASNKGSNETSQDHGHDHGLKTRMVNVRRHGHAVETNHDMKTFDVSSPLPTTAGGSAPLNITSFVDPADWQMVYNYMTDFETNETGHATMTIVIAVVGAFIPLAVAILKLLPFQTSRTWTYIQSTMLHPAAWGTRHRVPFILGMMPTRGQALYIAIVSFLNVVLLLAPYVITQPQTSFSSTNMQTLSIIGNRAGSMAMGNTVVLLLFSARNNVLFFFSDWSYSTYLILHRWLGYWAVFHTILHSLMLLAYYVTVGTYEAELAREYWVWGIVGTVAAAALIPSSFLWVRQKFYEAFLASHMVLSLLFLIGYYYHIWYCYQYKWGYEIWMFIAGAIWGADRLIRIGRLALGGSRTATVRMLENDDEYIHIEVDGSPLKGNVVYLCFPTLTWRFWETHPFSVAWTSTGIEQASNIGSALGSGKEAEGSADNKEMVSQVNPSRDVPTNHKTHSTTTFLCRTQTGITKALAKRASISPGQSTKVRVLIEGPYPHSGRVASALAHCSRVVCIAGGVGITGCLPHITSSDKNVMLFWSSRKASLPNEVVPLFGHLPSNVHVETTVGERLDLNSILTRELTMRNDGGVVGIIVCGPPGMADDVREKVTWLARYHKSASPYMLLDESFSW